MKKFALFASALILSASASIASAAPITGSIGFGGNGTYNAASGQFTPGGNTPVGSNAYVNVPGTGTLSMFTFLNPATFMSFNAMTSLPAMVFTTSELGETLTFTLTSFTATDTTNSAGPGFTGTGILSQTGALGNFDPTAASFSLNTNSAAGTFVTFNTATPAAVTPEPSSLMLLGTGLCSAAGMLVRKRRSLVA